MTAAEIDWLAFAVLLVLLGWTAYHFSRRTFRIVTLVILVIIVVLVTRYGLALSGHRRDFSSAFLLGGNKLAGVMLGPLTPDGARHLLRSGPGGWVVLAVILTGILACLDTWCTRREPPRVSVAEVPGTQAANDGLRREITEKLQFRLAAADVHKPAAIPGGSTLDNLATVVSSSDVQGTKTTAMLIRAVNALAAKPSTYQARLYAEVISPRPRSPRNGTPLRITVDVEDARTGAIIATRTLRSCSEADAADKAAGFTARQVFLRDPATPAWALGSLDGENLARFLISQEMSPKSAEPKDLMHYREEQRKELESADYGNADAVLGRYELACLYELLGKPLTALDLHLRNRVYQPWFLRGRYRLAMSLSMLASDPKLAVIPRKQGGMSPKQDGMSPKQAADWRRELVSHLDWAGTMLHKATLRKRRYVRQGAAAGAVADLRRAGTPGVPESDAHHGPARPRLLEPGLTPCPAGAVAHQALLVAAPAAKAVRALGRPYHRRAAPAHPACTGGQACEQAAAVGRENPALSLPHDPLFSRQRHAPRSPGRRPAQARPETAVQRSAGQEHERVSSAPRRGRLGGTERPRHRPGSRLAPLEARLALLEESSLAGVVQRRLPMRAE